MPLEVIYSHEARMHYITSIFLSDYWFIIIIIIVVPIINPSTSCTTKKDSKKGIKIYLKSSMKIEFSRRLLQTKNLGKSKVWLALTPNKSENEKNCFQRRKCSRSPSTQTITFQCKLLSWRCREIRIYLLYTTFLEFLTICGLNMWV